MNSKLLGSWGEATAASFLEKHGYAIVGMNYHSRFGEIDIIAKNRKFLAFVEVKMRKNADFGQAREFVDARKQQKIKTTAEIWLSQNETTLQPRFDVIEIYAPDGMQTAMPEIRHIESAFE